MANSPQAKNAPAKPKNAAPTTLASAPRCELTLSEFGAVEAKDADSASGALVQALPMIDKMVTKGIMHKNQAARHKSRLTKKVKALSSAE